MANFSWHHRQRWQFDSVACSFQPSCHLWSKTRNLNHCLLACLPFCNSQEVTGSHIAAVIQHDRLCSDHKQYFCGLCRDRSSSFLPVMAEPPSHAFRSLALPFHCISLYTKYLRVSSWMRHAPLTLLPGCHYYDMGKDPVVCEERNMVGNFAHYSYSMIQQNKNHMAAFR
jgi:hypothetical protein